MNLLNKKRANSLLMGFLVGSIFASFKLLANPTPVGLWKTINEDTKEAKSYVVLLSKMGLTGKIETILNKNKQDARGVGDRWGYEEVRGGSWEDGEISTQIMVKPTVCA